MNENLKRISEVQHGGLYISQAHNSWLNNVNSENRLKLIESRKEIIKSALVLKDMLNGNTETDVDEAEILGKILYDKIPARKINIINTHIITEPSDEEFLDKFFNYRGELYEIVE